MFIPSRYRKHAPSFLRHWYRRWLYFRRHLLRVSPKLIVYAYYRVALNGVRSNNLNIDLAQLHNELPNTGGVPVAVSYTGAAEIVEAVVSSTKRGVDVQGFEGFALDDAVFDTLTEGWERWTYAPLAGWLAKFGYSRFVDPSVLELGCGPAHLFRFLRGLGLMDYVGIDGHPTFVDMNRYLIGYREHFRTYNIQERIQLSDDSTKNLTFDMILCFEVLEHIREDKIDAIIWTMRQHLHKGSVVFCTASTVCGMDVHVLIRDRKWWLSRFEEFGLIEHAESLSLICQFGKRHPFNWAPPTTNQFVLTLANAPR